MKLRKKYGLTRYKEVSLTGKHIGLFLAAFLCIAKGVSQTKEPLIQVLSSDPSLSMKSEFLQKVRTNAKEQKVLIGQVQLDAFQEAEITIEGLSQQLSFTLQERSERTTGSYNWYGKAKKGVGSASFVVRGTRLSGSIQLLEANYVIAHLENGKVLIYEADKSQLPSEDCSQPERVFKMNPGGKNTPGAAQTYPELQNKGNVCNIKVLVAYTASAATGINGLGFTDIYDFAEEAIAINNQSFINSNVAHRLDLAAVVAINYNEAGGSFLNHVNRFQSTNDGFMDDIHGYRDQYSADVSILIVNDNEACGRASAIGSTAASAFCAVHFSCILNNFSFNHEIAHLHGCRHDTYVDNANTPFAYGHGFVSQANGWRTIMAYNDQCEDAGGDCTRLNSWSNPGINNGGVAMGTNATNDNARVLDETANQLRAYRALPVNLSLDNGEAFDINEGGEAVASNQVLLLPGFSSDAGSHFCAYISDPCNIAADANDNPTGDAEPFVEDEIISTEDVRVYPNPVKDQLYVALPPGKELSSVNIYNLRGEQVARAKTATLSVAHLAEGLYFVEIQLLNDEKIIKKVIVSRE